MENLTLVTARGNIEDVLRCVSENDNDFNGENGREYLWEGIEEYDSNKEYLLAETAELPPSERVAAFLKTWLGEDAYYDDYQYELLQLGEEDYFLALAFTS